jgi:hypothetical protein
VWKRRVGCGFRIMVEVVVEGVWLGDMVGIEITSVLHVCNGALILAPCIISSLLYLIPLLCLFASCFKKQTKVQGSNATGIKSSGRKC